MFECVKSWFSAGSNCRFFSNSIPLLSLLLVLLVGLFLSILAGSTQTSDNSWDKLAEQRLDEFKELHEQQLGLYGSDNLTVQEAYMKILGTSSGYINGLGFGPKPLKGTKEGSSNGEGIEIAHQIAQQLETNSKQREERLQKEIQMLQDDKVQMLREIEKLKQDAAVREERMYAQFRSMQEIVMQSMCSNTSNIKVISPKWSYLKMNLLWIFC